MRVSLQMLWLLPLATAAPAPTMNSMGTTGEAIYFLKNQPYGENSVVAMPVMMNGSLGTPVLTPTNGTGGYPITTLDTPAGIFFSQSSITTGGNWVFSCNFGSNSVSMFNISKDDPTKLTLVNTVPTMGDFPISVAYSDYLQQVCAVNSGGKGGVVCYNVTSNGLIMNGKMRTLDAAFNQSEPIPKGPVDSVTQILFDPASTMLWVVIKGNVASNPKQPGIMYGYPINGSTIATEGKSYQVDDLFLNFGTTFISESRALVSAPTLGGAIVQMNPSNDTLTQTTAIKVPDQRAICWSAFSQELNYGYLYDAGRTTVIVVDASNGEQVAPLIAELPNNNGTQGGLFDTWISGLYSYSLADPVGVVAMDLRMGKQIQYADLSGIGNKTDFWGMTGYSNKTSMV